MLDTPVLFLIFNRPDTTRIVFDAIRKASPKQLFIAADGPRQDRPEDIENCKLVREIALNIDWDCEVKTLFREENLGCGLAVSQAITWFFSNVDRGIILEDDTLPNKSFFCFCETLLELYYFNNQVMHISGSTFLKNRKLLGDAYYGSNYPNIWGWASWARAWKHYSFYLDNFHSFNELLSNGGINLTSNEAGIWKECFINTKSNVNNTWDYQWIFSVWCQGGICITPYFNMVTNIGFGKEGTHTSNESWEISNLPTFEMGFPLQHTKSLDVNRKNDYRTFKTVHYIPASLANRIRNFSYKIISYEKRRRYFGF